MKHTHLRYAMLLALEPAGFGRSVASIVSRISPNFDLGDRPSKLVSDVLRGEINSGRVIRVGWGTYQLVRIPRTTRQRAVAAISALTESQAQPPGKLANKSRLPEDPQAA